MSNKDSKETGGHDFERRENSLEEVRKRLRSGWRHDPHILDQYFQSCYNNWKVYTGTRTPKQVLKLQAIYKQGIYGDNNELPPDDLSTLEGEKWKAWLKLRGTPKEMAKRRFITYLAEIDPLLIDVMPDERPPIGFPLDRRGNAICAKCNTVVGCMRPIIDQNKMPLREILFDNEEFHEPEKLKEWVRSAMANQRCVWGIHMPITRAEAKPFMDWFNRDENRGFYPYDSAPIMTMVKDVVTNYHEMAQEMMESQEKIDSDAYNVVAIKCYKLKEIYESFSGEDYQFEVQCTRDNESCNQRRIADGGKNHMHEFVIDPPTKKDDNIMEEAIMLRKQCQRLGINPTTGVVKSLQERCEIYRQRIAEHFNALKRATEAKARNDNRVSVHKTEKETVIALSKDMLKRQMWDACQENFIDNIMVLAKRGSDVNEESPRGLTPLLCMVINEAVVEKIEILINTYSADINQPNKYGMTPLMMACRMKDMKMVHVLMRNGASALQKGYNGQTALHVCAIQGSEEIARTIVEYLKDGVGDSMRVTRVLDAMDDDGDTALIVAARRRNGIMCYTLCSLGCNPGIRNSTGRTAAYVARSKTWNEVCEWLDKKVGTGANRIETFSDLEFEKKCRFGLIKTRELLQNFSRTYLMLVQNRLGLHPLGTPYKAKSFINERGERARKEQRTFMDAHFRYILKRFPEQYPTLLASLPASYHNEHHHDHILSDTELQERLDELHKSLAEILKLIRLGYTYPNTDIPAQPIAWTPMMCAVALNDSRSVKILYREGGDPNYSNKDGTTPVMLAAQLQHNQVLVDLISIGGDLQAVDNMGYSAVAYATSLPLPTIMDRSYMDLMVNDDVGGPKFLSSEEIVKAALLEIPAPDPTQVKDQDRPTGKIGGPTGGVLQTATEKMKKLLAKNDEEASPENVETQSKFLQLLHQYGLTPIREEANIDYQLKSAKWRMKEKENKIDEEEEDEDEIHHTSRKRKKHDDNDDNDLVDDTYGGEARLQYEEEQEIIRKEKEEYLRKMDPNVVRCPICTLVPPCPHFFKIDSLLSFIKKNRSVKVSDGGAATGGISIRMQRKVKMKNRAKEVLEETEINDRNTDRSATLARKYQAREKSIEKNRAQRTAEENRREELAALEAADCAVIEAEARASGLLVEEDEEELFDIPSKPPSSPTTSSKIPSPSSSPQEQQQKQGQVSADSSSAESSASSSPVSVDGMSDEAENDVYSRLPGSAGGLPLVKEGEFTPEMALSVIPIPILKQRDNTPGHSRRVRFNLPAEEEEEEEEAAGDAEEDQTLTNTPANVEDQTQIIGASTDDSTDSSNKSDASPPSITKNSSKAKKKLSKRNRSSSNKSVELRISDDKAVKHFQENQEFTGWPKVGEDEENQQQSDNILLEMGMIPSAQDAEAADEDDYDIWYEEQENKEKEEENKELRIAYDILVTGRGNKEYIAEQYEREKRELHALQDHARVFPFNKDQGFGFNDGIFADMKHVIPPAQEQETLKDTSHHTPKLISPGLEAAQRKITLPGYLFFHLSDMHSPTLPPISMSVTQTAWIKILENLNDSFQEEWQHQLDFSVLIHQTDWTVTAPPCILCQIGYIRNKDTLILYRNQRDRYEAARIQILNKLFSPHASNISENHPPSSMPSTPTTSNNTGNSSAAESSHQHQHHNNTTIEDEQHLLPFLCFSCIIRRELYHRVLKTQPRSIRRTLHTRWPLLATHDPHFNHMPAMEGVDEVMNQHAIAPLPKHFPPLGIAQSPTRTKQEPMQIPAGEVSLPLLFGGPASSLSSSSVENKDQDDIQTQQLTSTSTFFGSLLGSNSQSRDNRDNFDTSSGHESDVIPDKEEHMLDQTEELFVPVLSKTETSIVTLADLASGNIHGNSLVPFAPSSPSTSSSSNLPLSPIKSEKLRALDEMFERQIRQQLSDIGHHMGSDLLEDDIPDDVSQVSSLSQVSISYEKNWMIKTLTNLEVDSTVKQKMINNANASQFSRSSIGSTVTVSTVSQVNPLKRPREMTLLPYYIAQGLFDDSERLVRILLGKPAIDEGEGHAFLLEILMQLAESYKLSGLYLLSLSVYLDVLTRTIALCGWLDRLTYDVCLPSLLLCYRRMGLENDGQTFMKNLFQDLNISLRKSGKQEVIKKLHHTQRQTLVRFIKINSLWTRYLQSRLFDPPEKTEANGDSSTGNNNGSEPAAGAEDQETTIDDTKVPTTRHHSTSHNNESQPNHPLGAPDSVPVLGKQKQWHRFERLLGLVGLYVFYTSAMPVFVTQRKVFREYCHGLHRQYTNTMSSIARWQRQRERVISKQQQSDASSTSSNSSTNNTYASNLSIEEIDKQLQDLEKANKVVSNQKYISSATYQYLHVIVDFLDVYFTIYQVEDPIVYRYLLQHLWRHFLTRSLFKVSPLPKLFRKVTSRAHILEIAYFFRFGKDLSLSVFDALVHQLLQDILPCYRRFFVHAEAGESYRESFLVTIGGSGASGGGGGGLVIADKATADSTAQPSRTAEGNAGQDDKSGDGNGNGDADGDDEGFVIPAIAEALDQAAMILQSTARAYLTRKRYIFGPAVRKRLLAAAKVEAMKRQEEARLAAIAENERLEKERIALARKKRSNARLSVALPTGPTLQKRQHY